MQDSIKQKIQNANNILFVCSGNIVRSSFAELYARHLGMLNVGSYGTTYFNHEIHKKSSKELEGLGIENNLLSSFKPRHISEIPEKQLFDKKTIHIVMTSNHQKILLDQGINKENIFKINIFNGTRADVADPYFEGNWEEAYSSIKSAVEQIIALVT